MGAPVTDPAILAALNADDKTPSLVTDPAILAQLNGGDHPADSGVMHTIDNAVRAIANGATFGLADRFAAGMGSLTGVGGQSGDYAGNLKSEQDKTDQFASDHPIGNVLGQTAGALATLPVGLAGRAVQGVGLGAKVLAGAGTGAVLGGLQGGLSSHDYTNLPQTMRDSVFGAGTGAVLGGAVPVAGAGIGAGFNALMNATRSVPGIPRAVLPHLLPTYADNAASIGSELDRLGPQAMLGDANPALLGKLQGAALNSDEGRTVSTNALKSRDVATNQRIAGDVNRAVGPAEDPQTVTNAILEHRTNVDNAAYPAALGNAPPVDIAPVIKSISTRLEQTPVGSMEYKALTYLQSMLTRKVPRPEDAPAGVAAPVGAAPEDATTAALRAKFGDAVADAYVKQNAKAPVAPLAAAPAPSAPSLLEFLAQKGGLGPDSELGAIGADNHTVNVDGVGRRKLVKQGGLPLDYAREAAEEAGYLQGDHKGTSSVRDLLDAVDAEMRGQKRYPAGMEGSVGKRQASAMSEREQAEYDAHMRGFEDDLAKAGHGQLGPDVKARAVDLMSKQGMDADTAVDHAVNQLEQEDAAKAGGAFPGDQANHASVAGPKNDIVPHTNANILHKIKGELDNIIEYDAPGLGVPAGALKNQQGALKLLRGQLNDTLEKQVPGYLAANRQSAALAKRADAVKDGTQYLGSGKTTPSPDRFAAEFNPLSHGEKIAFAKGSRGNIDRVLGTKSNDLQALKGELQGEGGWNTAKLATVHGQDAADQLIGSVDRNLKFRDTYQKVVEGSQTDIRNAARKAMKPDPSTETPVINPNMSITGLAGTVAKKAVAAAFNAAVKRDPTKAFGDVARVLTAQGAQRDAYHDALVNALNRRLATSATAGKVGHKAAVAAAVAANQYLRGPYRGPNLGPLDGLPPARSDNR